MESGSLNLSVNKFERQKRVRNEGCVGISGLCYREICWNDRFERMMNNGDGCEGITGSFLPGKSTSEY